MRRLLVLLVFAALPFVFAAEAPAAPITVTVNSTADPGNGVCDVAECTLREAISTTNANAGADTIQFAIGAVGSSQTISPTSALPGISEAVTIDGWTQGGGGYTGPPLIRIDGFSAGSASGLVVNGGSTTIRGLIVTRFSANGIWLNSSANVLTGNWIGNATATALPNGTGVHVGDGTAGKGNNRIGTDGDNTNDTAERNVIAGNTGDGIFVEGSGNGDVISGNYIGIDASGASLGNGGPGIRANSGASGVLIGTDGSGFVANEGNVISANGNGGISIFSSVTASANANVIAGNRIGTNTTGTIGLGNTNGGINLYGTFDNSGNRFPVSGTRIGTNFDGNGDSQEANVISANTNGQGIQAFVVDGSNIAGNFIGTDASATTNLGNSNYGILLAGGTNNQIGGANAVQKNTVRFNGSGGVSLQRGGVGNAGGNWTDPTLGNTILNNLIANNGCCGIGNNQTEELASGAASAPGDGPTDNTISGNTIQNNTRGIVLAGSSPAIDGNVITGSGGNGIEIDASFFEADDPVNGLKPSTAGNDFLSRPTIGTNSPNVISGNCANTGGSPCAGIYSLDTKATNEGTLFTGNTPGANNGFPFVRQDWYGTVETIFGGNPTNGSVTVTSANGGPTYTMNFTAACPIGEMGGTIIHGPLNTITCTNITTWPKITQYVVNDAGVRTDYTPETANALTYSFDGNAATNPRNTGAGFNGEGIQTGPYSRYQIMEVPGPATAVVALAWSSVRRSGVGVAVSWRTANEAKLVGFNVWRSGRRVNAALIPAKRSGQARGAVYRFVDHLARRGAYRLELVRLDGGRSFLPLGA